MSDQQVVVRPARAGDEDRVWPLVRDFATSFVPDRAAFGATWARLVVAPDTPVVVAAAGPVHRALDDEDSAVHHEKTSGRLP